MWSKPIVLSSNYCKNKTGIVDDDEYASWEFRTMVSFILMSRQVTGKSLI